MDQYIEERLKKENNPTSPLDRIILFSSGIVAAGMYPFLDPVIRIVYHDNSKNRSRNLKHYRGVIKGSFQSAWIGDWKYFWEAGKEAGDLESSSS